MYHAYGVPPEAVRLALVIGIVVSVVLYERFWITSGAMVVAGYFALFVDRPLRVVTALTLAVATYFIVDYVISQRVFLYGRRRLMAMVLVALTLEGALGTLAFAFHRTAPWVVGLYGIGFVLPGLIAQDMDRQGVRLTLVAAVGGALATFGLLRVLMALEGRLPALWQSTLIHDLAPRPAYPLDLLVPAVVISVVLSAALYETTGWRSGGFVTAAYMALFVNQPEHLVFVVLASALVLLVVRHLLLPYTPIFGRTKFAAVVLTSVIAGWGLQIALSSMAAGRFELFPGFNLIGPMIIALIANDGERQGLPKTYLAVAGCTAVVYTAMLLVTRGMPF